MGWVTPWLLESWSSSQSCVFVYVSRWVGGSCIGWDAKWELNLASLGTAPALVGPPCQVAEKRLSTIVTMSWGFLSKGFRVFRLDTLSPKPYPKALRTHILRLWPKDHTI